MTDIEERLRTVLSRHAEEAPTGESVLPGVREKSSRRRRRHRLVLVGALAAAVVVAMLAAPTAVERLGNRTPSARISTSAVASLVAGSPVDVTVPLSTPSLFQQSGPVATLVAGRPTLTYTSTDDHRAKITVIAVSEPPPAGTKPFQLGDRHGVMLLQGVPAGERLIAWWPIASGWWVEINTPADMTLSVLAKYAAAFMPGSTTVSGPFVFDLLPADYTVDNIDATHVSFCPPQIAASQGMVGKIVVSIDVTPAPADWRTVTIGGRPGRIGNDGDDTEVRTDLGNGRVLSVRVPTGSGMTTTDLIRFAAGVHAH